MVETEVMGQSGPDPAPRRGAGGRRIERRRGLPGGRAVVGAFLIAAAAIAVFAAYLDAVADPETHYLVATDAITPGTVIADRETALELFGSLPLALTAPVDGQVFGVDELDQLVGQVVLSEVGAGELLQRSVLLDQERLPDSQVMSFALPVADAVGGSLTPGELVDVLATYRTGSDAHTAYVVRAVPVLGVEVGSGGASVILTVAIADPQQVQALGHAVNTASVFVTTSAADGGAELLDGYRVPPPGSSLEQTVDPDGSEDEAGQVGGTGETGETGQRGGTGEAAESGETGQEGEDR